MSIPQLTNLLVTVTLIEMMVVIGLGVTPGELLAAARNARLTLSALVANYVLVPAAAVGLLLGFQTPPMTAAGFLILAVCPGAPYGPPLTALARGNVPVAVGLMALLAGSSAILAPLLLYILLPLFAGDEALSIDAPRLVVTLLVTQLLPLCAGLWMRVRHTPLADRLQGPAQTLSKILNLAVVVLILATQFRTLAGIPPRACLGMMALLVATLAAGWVLGGPANDGRKSMTLTTALRNVGLSMVIAAGAFEGTPALTAVLAYGIFEVLATLLIAAAWGRLAIPSRR